MGSKSWLYCALSFLSVSAKLWEMRKTTVTKKVIPGLIVLILIVVTMVAATVNFQQVTQLFSQASQNKSASTSPTVGGTYNFSCITDKKCQFLTDGSQKTACYDKCKKTLPDSGLGTLTSSQLASKHLTYINNYIPLYSGTRRGNYQEYAKNTKVMTTYARANCSDIAANAIVGLVENKSQSYFTTQTERLTAVFDDANVWASPKAADFWLSPSAGYQCGLAASLLWNKFESATAWDKIVNKPNRSANDKREMIKTVLLQLAKDTEQEFNKDYYKQRMKTHGKTGNSHLEEMAFVSAYLAFVNQMFPSSGEQYLKRAKELAVDSMKYCRFDKAAFEICAYDGNFKVANHGLYPQPHYGLSGIMHNAWSGLPFYTFGRMNRDNIPTEFRLLSKSVYNLVNAFEGTAQNIDFVNFKYTGTFEDWDGSRNTNFSKTSYEELEYNGRNGVTEWGMGPEYHAGAVTYMFVNDPFNSSNYRASVGPVAWFIKGNDDLMKIDKLYLPATIGQPRKMLESLHAANEPFPLIASSNGEKENVHFVLNSFKAFEHVIGFLYTTDKNYLNKME